jgi:hypothetical protein
VRYGGITAINSSNLTWFMLLKYKNSIADSHPQIHICSLGTAKEIDHSTYDGVITIEDSLVDEPLRINQADCPQLVLCFDDIASCLSPLELCQYILAKGVRKHGTEALF